MVSPVNSLIGSASSAIAAGNFAGNLATSATGGLGSIAGAVGAANSISSATAAAAAAMPALTGNMSTDLTAASGAVNGLASKLPGLPALPAMPEAGLVDSAKGVAASAFSAITSSFKSLKAGVPQNLSAIATSNAAAAAAAEAGTPTVTAPLTDSQKKWLGNADPTDPIILARMKAAVPDAGGSVAGGSLSAVTSLSGILPNAGQAGAVATSVSGAVGKITSSVSATVAGASSGVNALPGGLGAVSSVVDNAKGAINSIPGTSAISGAIGNATSAVTNGLSAVTGALSKLGAPASLTAGFNTLKAGVGTLSALASTGLSPSASAKMNAAIASLSSGGSVPIKLPVVAVNTTDRGELSAGLSAVFGSTKIAAPNFGGNPATFGTSSAVAELDAQKALLKKVNAAADAKDAAYDASISAQTDYKESAKTLPAGDPQLAVLKTAWTSAYDKWVAARDEFIAVAKTIPS